jgi:hypothetical protein
VRDFKERIDKLVTDAADCDLIGSLSADASKRESFRRVAKQFRTIAAELKFEMDGTALPPMSDREFLLRHAKDFRDLATALHEEDIRAALLRMAKEFEQKAAEDRERTPRGTPYPS